MICTRCGREISRDEAALCRKLINRGTTAFFCFDCLAEDFKLKVEDLKEMIVRFREAGCSLFL